MNVPGFLIPDPLAAAVAINPDIAIETVHLPVSIETRGKYGRGLTSVDWQQQSGKTPNTKIVLTADEHLVNKLIQDALAQ